MSAFIEAIELRKTYRVGKIDVPALRGISFTVQKGEFVSVVARPAAGSLRFFICSAD
jgi:putative ABC transport system ATP-binding protein